MMLAILLLLELLSLTTMPSVLLRRRGNPVSATGWLVALVALPGVAWVAWWTVGRTRLDRKTRRHNQARSRFSQTKEGVPTSDATVFRSFVPSRAWGTDAFYSAHNEAQVLLDGKEVFPALESEIRAAKSTIHLFFFTFEMDETGTRLLDLLIERSQNGIVVRLLVDGLGSGKPESEIRKRLEGTNVQFGVFLPKKLVHLPRFNFVNHRKIVVIDDQLAFTGGCNVGDDYARHWRDLMVKLRGPVVFGLNHTFLEDWYFATDELLTTPPPPDEERQGDSNCLMIASGPSTEGWIHDAFFSAIAAAKERLWLTTPYLIPTPAIRQALRSAAGRGVDVRIVLPRESDVLIACWAARPYYRTLLRDGVRLFEYENMVHGKALLVDDCCCVGSANLDYRSMELSFEVCCFVDDPVVTQKVSEWITDLIAGSDEKAVREIDQMSMRERTLDSLAHLFSPLL